MNVWAYILLFVQICGMVAGQLLTKEGVDRIGQISIGSISAMAASPWLWSGALIYIGASALWLWLLSKGDFTVLVPLQSLSMVITVIAGAIILREDVSMVRWLGVGLMTIGAIMVAK